MELIKIQEKNGEKLASARELHTFLESKQEFTNWIKARIEKYGFVENEDFLINLSESTGGRPSTDYILKMDMAKEISMVEGNEKGKQARKYFIQCEDKILEIKNNLPKLSEMEMIAKIAISQDETIKRIDTLEQKFDTVLTLESHKQRIIQKAIAKRVYDRFGLKEQLFRPESGYTQEDAQSCRKRYFSNIHRELKDKFGVTSYKDIKVVQYEDALAWINNWIEDAGILD